MKHIKKYNENKQPKRTFKNSDNDIKEFFIDYHDSGRLKIEDKFIFNGAVINATPYMKDISKYRKCKIITINLGKPDGIHLWNKTCITNLELLSQAVHDIQSFYDFMEEDINYSIETDYMGLNIKFVTLGDDVDKSETLASDIDGFLKRIKDEYTNRGYKRITIKRNRLDILIPKTGGVRRSEGETLSIGITLSKIGRGETTLDNMTNPRLAELINIRNEAWEKGLKINASTYDRQIVVSFEKR